MTRTPRNYQGMNPSHKLIGDLIPKFMQKIGRNYEQKPDLILKAWSDLIGPQLLPMTQAVSFMDGILTVKVKNSTLHSLLSQNEKGRLLNKMKEMFPGIILTNIVFRIG
ncbi:MAG: DUF721 domain-containing protein [Rhabdochlamydiaceae bacterium]